MSRRVTRWRWVLPGAACAAVAALAASSVAGAAPSGAAASRAAASRAAASGAAPASHAGRVALPSPIPSWTAFQTDDGPAPASLNVTFRIYLSGRAPAAERAFATAVSTPGNARFRQYLTPSQFAAAYGPSAEQLRTVTAWARSAGLVVSATSPQYLSVSGSAPAVSRALGTSIHAFGPKGQREAFAPVSGISLPATIAPLVSTIVGLDDNTGAGTSGDSARPATETAAAAPPRCSQFWGQHTAAIPATHGRTTAPTPVCGYTPAQLRSAYGVSALTGRGATIAIVLDGHLPSMEADADIYFAAHGVAGFAPGQFTENEGPGFTRSCGNAADLPEEPLDVETAHIIAPDARVVYVAANCAASISGSELAFLDAETRIVDQHLADVETDSYSTLESGYTPAMAAAWSQIMEQGAAEGIGFNFDSGDGGDDENNDPNTPPAVTFPASDPWATAVGGTTLELDRSGAVTRELGWGDTVAQENRAGTRYLQPPPGVFNEGSTGGRSILFPEPAYQRGVVPRALTGSSRPVRVVPDVAADADALTGWLIGYTAPHGGYRQIVEGGTSGSSPIIAALEADAKQASGLAVGFANPAIYALRATAAIRDIRAPGAADIVAAPRSDCFADIQPVAGCLVSLGLDSSLHATLGFDDVTGVGAATAAFAPLMAQPNGTGTPTRPPYALSARAACSAPAAARCGA